MLPKTLVYVGGLLQAIVIAVGAYLAQPNDPTGRPLLIAIAGVVLSVVVSFITGRKVTAAVAKAVAQVKVFP